MKKNSHLRIFLPFPLVSPLNFLKNLSLLDETRQDFVLMSNS